TRTIRSASSASARCSAGSPTTFVAASRGSPGECDIRTRERVRAASCPTPAATRRPPNMLAVTVASGFSVSSAFRVPGNTAALGVTAPSGTVGQVRIDYAGSSGGPWATLQQAGTGLTFIVTSGPAVCGVVTAVLGPYFRLNLSANQTASVTFAVTATRVN